jgi:hypothetical protein
MNCIAVLKVGYFLNLLLALSAAMTCNIFIMVKSPRGLPNNMSIALQSSSPISAGRRKKRLLNQAETYQKPVIQVKGGKILPFCTDICGTIVIGFAPHCGGLSCSVLQTTNSVTAYC